MAQWRRSVVKSEGSGSLRSSHQTRSRPKFVFVSGAGNGLFGHFWLFPFSAENEFSFVLTKLCDISGRSIEGGGGGDPPYEAERQGFFK